MKIVWSHRARADLVHIRQYISRDNPAAANRMALAIVASTDRLLDNPRIGRIGARPGTFELVVRSYVIVYELSGETVFITSIWHGARRRPGT